MSAPNTTTEYVPQLIGWSALALIAFLLGPAGLVAATAPLVAVWYFGSMEWAFLAGLVGLMGFAITTATGNIEAGAAGLWTTVAAIEPALLRSPSSVLQLWLGSSAERATAVVQVAGGLVLGGSACLILADRRRENEPAVKPKPPETPRPGQRRRAEAVQQGPANVGEDLVLGWDWDTGRPIVLSEPESRTPLLVVGASGGGKTNTQMNIAEAAIDRGDPVVLLDGKGDPSDAPKIIEYAKKMGRKTYLIMPDREDCASYTPFVGTDYTMMTDLVLGLREWTEDHYRVVAKMILQTVFMALVAIGEPIDLIVLSTYLQPGELQKAVRKHRAKLADADRLMQRVFRLTAHEKDLITLKGLVDTIAESSLAPLFDTRSGRPVLTLRKAREEGAVVVVSLPALRYEDAARSIGHLFISDLRATLTFSKRRWVVQLDELTSFSGPTVLNLVNQGRGYGARLILGTQSFADLIRSVSSSGDAFADQILASVNTLILHRLNSPRDAELAAKFAGTFLKPEITSQLIGEVESGVGSSRMTREFWVGPDELKEATTGEAYMVVKSSNRLVHLRARRSRIDL